jgi:hypothetical protein
MLAAIVIKLVTDGTGVDVLKPTIQAFTMAGRLAAQFC